MAVSDIGLPCAVAFVIGIALWSYQDHTTDRLVRYAETLAIGIDGLVDGWEEEDDIRDLNAGDLDVRVVNESEDGKVIMDSVTKASAEELSGPTHSKVDNSSTCVLTWKGF